MSPMAESRTACRKVVIPGRLLRTWSSTGGQAGSAAHRSWGRAPSNRNARPRPTGGVRPRTRRPGQCHRAVGPTRATSTCKTQPRSFLSSMSQPPRCTTPARSLRSPTARRRPAHPHDRDDHRQRNRAAPSAHRPRHRADALMMTHRSSPLTPEGRRRLSKRCRTRPVAHIAAEMGISRATTSKSVTATAAMANSGWSIVPRLSWNNRPSQRARSPNVSSRCGASTGGAAPRIALELGREGVPVSRRTGTRLLTRLGLNRRKLIDPNRETNRRLDRRQGSTRSGWAWHQVRMFSTP